ncbi:MAG: bifunctional diaminohydroxyphosphoribosylaminopyrimidine deaminase/5-amino-6-(5-phosphoribosylamino)uracil reductase RibD [Sphingomonas sp.]|jgi:diaminohydroxyphosphoribosylaminopyrimidine deaminase/5-amino-6-(5-phosphoribosylamino)uracil reductase
MCAALALAERGRGQTAPNPSVGCLIVQGKQVVGRGWTQPGGRPHAEAMALAQAGAAARGATAYVTLEPCAHLSLRGRACADILVEAGISRLVCAMSDPDPRTNGAGAARLMDAGVEVAMGVCAAGAARSMAGFLARQALGRPAVTLKLATSLDGCIALASGESRWITGAQARAHTHMERARHDAILVGRGTLEVDAPRLDVRLAGLEHRAPRRVLLSRSAPPQGWAAVASPAAIAALDAVNDLLVEGGAQTAAAFLERDLVDRLLLYRAPVLVGGGKAALGDIGLGSLASAHGRWRLVDTRLLGSDRMEHYERVRG